MTFATSVAFVDPAWTSWDAGVQTDSKTLLGEAPSRTIVGDVADRAHATDSLDWTRAQVRNVWPASEPKKSDPSGAENEETEESKSGGVMDPKTANSRTGREESEEERREVLEGGVEEPERTN